MLWITDMLWIEVTVNRPTHDKAWGADDGGTDRTDRTGNKGKPAFRQA